MDAAAFYSFAALENDADASLLNLSYILCKTNFGLMMDSVDYFFLTQHHAPLTRIMIATLRHLSEAGMNPRTMLARP